MNKYLPLIPIASAMFFSNSSITHAADESTEWYVSPMLSYIKSDSDRDADNDLGVMLGLGKKINQQWNLEVSAVIDSLDLESGSGEFKQRGLMVDGLYFFDRDTVMKTYAIVGAGIMNTDTGSQDSNNPMLNVGVGMMQKLSDSGIALRADVRYRFDMDDESLPSEDEFGDLMLNVGLTIPFGSTHKVKQANMSVKPVNKTNTSNNEKIASVVDSAQEEKSVTAKEVETVAAKDSDNDGIADNKDNCPSSAEGEKVDSTGCKLQQSFVLKGVNFVTGSNILEDESKNTLNDVAETFARNPDINVEVAGYTDNRGNVGFNQRLSQKRAESVKAYLISQGVDEGRMIAKGYGIDSPIADNANSQGRAINRRVELHLIK